MSNLRDYIDAARDERKPLDAFTETDIAIATSPRMSTFEAAQAIGCTRFVVKSARRKYANPRLVELMLEETGA